MSLFAQSGTSPNVTRHVDQVHTILAMAQAGPGHGLMPQSATTFRYDEVVFSARRWCAYGEDIHELGEASSVARDRDLREHCQAIRREMGQWRRQRAVA